MTNVCPEIIIIEKNGSIEAIKIIPNEVLACPQHIATQEADACLPGR